MNEEQLQKSLEYAQDLRVTISEARNYSQSVPMGDLFMLGERIIGTMAFLISPLLEFEHRYREEKVKYIDEGMSVSSAESKAQTSQNYKNYRQLKMTYELAEEAQKMLKKFADKLGDEYSRS